MPGIGHGMAVIQGIGYENSSRSHFRAMDIWHTCEPDKIATEGWLAKVVREIDPDGGNPLTAVSMGRGLPRALAAPEKNKPQRPGEGSCPRWHRRANHA